MNSSFQSLSSTQTPSTPSPQPRLTPNLHRLPRPPPIRIDNSHYSPNQTLPFPRTPTPKLLSRPSNTQAHPNDNKQPTLSNKQKILRASVLQGIGKENKSGKGYLRQTYQHSPISVQTAGQLTSNSQASTPKNSTKGSMLFQNVLASQFQGEFKFAKANSYQHTRCSSKEPLNNAIAYRSTPHSKQKVPLSSHNATTPRKIQKAILDSTPITPRAFKKSFRNSVRPEEAKRRGMGLLDFQVGACLGQGRFGRVFMARHRQTGWWLALKRVRVQQVRLILQQFTMQLKLSMFVDNPNIVKTYACFIQRQYFYMVMQLLEEGALYKKIKANNVLDYQQSGQKLHDICQAIDYLHSNDIIHRDIKPQNIVMSHGVCKLCDLGWAAYTHERRNTYCGTLDYVSPDLLSGQSYDHFVDVWAVGVLAYQMMSGKAPFYHASKHQTMNNIRNREMTFPEDMPLLATRFISKILLKPTEEALSIRQLLKQPLLSPFQREQWSDK